MKNLILAVIGTGLLISGGCARSNDSGKIAREKYHLMLEDSIKSLTVEIDSCRAVSRGLSDEVNNLLRDFTAVNNSREVEGYTIFQGWANKYPLRSTGLVARINASEQLELVAALWNGVFDHIVVTSGAESSSTAVVPYDQALNYRRNGLNTVMFSGKEADAVALLIADNELNPITVNFMNGDVVSRSWSLPLENAKMIAVTDLLYRKHSEQKELERRAMMLSEKVKLIRQHQPVK